MLELFKKIVRAVVPPEALARAKLAGERRELANLPVGKFSVGSLRRISRDDLNAAFQSEQISAAWHRDLPRISASMPFADIFGGVCPGERRAIYHLIAFFKPKRVLEIGTHIGASTLVIAQALATHADSDSRMVTGDILDVNNPAQGAYNSLGTLSPREALTKLGVVERVRFEVKPAQELMASIGEKMDFIFLDGDHSAKAVYQELSIALDLLTPGGLILLHDFYPGCEPIYPVGVVTPGPFLASERVHSEISDIQILPLGNLPWETKQGVTKTSLALVTRR